MSKEQLKHIFDESVCLTKKQLRDYVAGTMTSEEAHAVELHLNSCPMCSDAVDGMWAVQESGLKAVGELNVDFLQTHFDNISQQSSNSTVTSTATKEIPFIKKSNNRPLWRITSIAAALLFLVTVFWYYRFTTEESGSNSIAQDVSLPKQIAQEPAKAVEQTIPVADTEVQEDISKSVTVAATSPAAIKESENTKSAGVVAMAADEATKEKKPGFFKRLENKVEAIAAKKTTDNILGAIKNDDPDKYATSDKNQFVEERKQKPQEEIVVTQYKVPLIGEDERKVISSEELEKLPTRSTGNMAASNAGVRNMDAGATRDADAGNGSIDKLEQANKLYEARKYTDALNVYTQAMNAATNKTRKQQAAIGAARSYLALGNKIKAKAMLQSIIDEGGPQKREAKRLMKEAE